MARFRYRMQGILDIKLKMETQAKQNFANARNALDDELHLQHFLYLSSLCVKIQAIESHRHFVQILHF